MTNALIDSKSADSAPLEADERFGSFTPQRSNSFGVDWVPTVIVRSDSYGVEGAPLRLISKRKLFIALLVRPIVVAVSFLALSAVIWFIASILNAPSLASPEENSRTLLILAGIGFLVAAYFGVGFAQIDLEEEEANKRHKIALEKWNIYLDSVNTRLQKVYGLDLHRATVNYLVRKMPVSIDGHKTILRNGKLLREIKYEPYEEISRLD